MTSENFAEMLTVKRLRAFYDKFVKTGIAEYLSPRGDRYFKVKTHKWKSDDQTKAVRFSQMMYKSLVRIKTTNQCGDHRQLAAFCNAAIGFHLLKRAYTPERALEIFTRITEEEDTLSKDETDHIVDLLDGYIETMAPERHYEIVLGDVDDL